MRLTGATLVLAIFIMSGSLSRAELSPPQDKPVSASDAPSQPGTIAAYLGVPVTEIELPGIPADDAAHLLAATPLKLGEPLTRSTLHDAMQSLFATGRFADIQAEADRSTAGVRLRFLTVPNYFIGQITADGVSSSPSPNQLVTSSRLQLGELYSQDKLDKAQANLQRVLEDNGFHRSKIAVSIQRTAEQHQIDLTFHVDPGPRATVGQIVLEGDAGFAKEELEEIAKFHPGEGVAAARLTRALQRIRARYQKQDRLLAQVSVAVRTYRPESNTVDYTFKVERGPVVEIAADGFSVSQRQLRKLVPIYEEGAVDDDLLNEGRRNLQNHLQALGYFAATVTVSQRGAQDGKNLNVIYTITPGDRRRLAAIRISGNKLFEDDLIRRQMLSQPAGRLFSHGRYSDALLEGDVRNIQELYRSAGFRQVQVTSKLQDNYLGDPVQIAVDIEIKEGPQTRVSSVSIAGNYNIPTEQLTPKLSTEEGQGFNESSLADDRDTILERYFDNGFTNAAIDVSYVPDAASTPEAPAVGVVFNIHEGEQFFVSQVFLNGLHYTRPGVARREVRVQPGAPLSQQDMLGSQRSLYNLGLFNEVDTAIQNPDGTESRKNVLVSVRETKRYTFDYGVGFEFQTGQPSVGTNQPLGQTGVSPRVSFGVSRLNIGGRHQTVSAKTSLSRLQQRGLISFEAPKLLNKDLNFSIRLLYDNTVDVSTFTSQRTEATLQTVQILKRDPYADRDLDSIAYRFSYRRVQASNIQVSDNLVPLLSKPTRVGEPNFLYVRNRRDNDLETIHGNYTTVEGGVAASYFGSEADFSRFLVKNSTYYPFLRNRRTGTSFVFARSTSVGLENPFGDTILLGPTGNPQPGQTLIPLPERFFMGGGSSHRGFGLNQAGPRDPFTGFPIGGSALFLNNLELRFPNVALPYLHDNIGFSVFHDVGNVFSSPQNMVQSLGRWHQPNPDACKHQNGVHNELSECNYNYVSQAVGLGVRYQTPIGPLRLDFGYNLNPPFFPSFTNIVVNQIDGTRTGQFGFQRAGHFNFSFSIGQSF